MLRSVEVDEYMLNNPVSVSVDADLFEAIRLILDNKISGLCVTDSEGQLVGVLSELDCLNAILSAMYDDRTSVGSVRDYMTAEMVTSLPHEDIVDVAADMVQNSHRRRPVIKDGKLVGQITCRQLLKAVTGFSSGKKVTSLPKRYSSAR